MARREIMVRAHEVARTLEGDYRARMSAGLRQAWMEARLIASGGNLWERGQHRRIYLNNLTELYGLELHHYGSGRVRSASLNGEGISNRRANELAHELRWGKLWYDLNTGRFASRDLDRNIASEIVERIAA